MNKKFSNNLIRLRKEHNMTQENLAKKLGVSFQAISKWENCLSYPDIELLPEIASIFNISLDALLGYQISQTQITEYEKRYQTSDFYWGLEPNHLCYEIMKTLPPIKPYRLLDIGCGEGKDAVFLARNGYAVSAFDVADAGLEKAKQLAQHNHVNINFFKANILDFTIDNEFDIIFCSGVLHYLPQNIRNEFFNNLKSHTAQSGINVMNVFVQKPFLSKPIDAESNRQNWISGELFTYYNDWLFDKFDEVIFDCNSGGSPHKHCMNIMIARKI